MLKHSPEAFLAKLLLSLSKEVGEDVKTKKFGVYGWRLVVQLEILTQMTHMTE